MILPKVLIILDKHGVKAAPKFVDLFSERDKPGSIKITIVKALPMDSANARLLKEIAIQK